MDRSRENLEFQQDLELLLAEVGELLAATEENLVELEKSPDDTALIQEVFRVMHTIKGGAATLGLSEAVDVSHGMENVLDKIRSGERALTTDLMDVLFQAVDWLKEWKSALTKNEDVPSNTALVSKIQKVASEGVGSPQQGLSTSAAQTSLKIPAAVSKKLESVTGEGKVVHQLTVAFRPDTELLSVRCFQILTLIEEGAEVIASVPSLEDIENDKAGDTLVIFLVAEDGGAEAKSIAEANQDVSKVTVSKYRTAKRAEPIKTAQEMPVVKRSDLGRTVRVDVALLDFLMNMVGELVIDRTRLSQIATQLMRQSETASAGSELSSLAAHLQRTSTELQEGIMQARLLPMRSIFSKFPRMMRDLSQRCGKEIDFVMMGENTELDRTVLEAIDDPLIHILRNSVDHGIESPEVRVAAGKPAKGRVLLSAQHEENQVVVRVEDDGAGIDAEKVKRSAVKKGIITEEAAQKLSEKEAVELIFMPGFSTNDAATEVSGRGVGMDVVRSNLERVNGQVEIKTRLGQGTTTILRLPLTLAIMRALLVQCGDNVYAIPTSSVEEVLSMDGVATGSIKGRPAMNVRGKVVPLVSLEGALKDAMWEGNGYRYALLTRSNDQPLALGVDGLIGEEEVVVKEMGHMLSRLKGIAGATILAQGDPAIILDVNRVV
jgi:two-component system chemotaxis sensor kinase CheA